MAKLDWIPRRWGTKSANCTVDSVKLQVGRLMTTVKTWGQNGRERGHLDQGLEGSSRELRAGSFSAKNSISTLACGAKSATEILRRFGRGADYHAEKSPNGALGSRDDSPPQQKIGSCR